MMIRHVRLWIAWMGLFTGLGLLVAGLALADTQQWRLHLLLGIWLLSLVPRYYLTQKRPQNRHAQLQLHGGGSRRNQLSPMAYGLTGLALMLALSFVAVSFQLIRTQVSQASVIRGQREALFAVPPAPPDEGPPPIPAAERVALGDDRIWPVNVQYEQRGRILNHNGEVLAVTENGRRIYPNPNMGHIVGLQSALYGTTGVEGTFDDYLSGEFLLSAPDLLTSRLAETAVQAQGADVYLTIDSSLQQVAEQALGNRAGAVVLMDVQTGAIRAMATYPRFDPNPADLAGQPEPGRC
ncbi:MAG: hypothetical protein HC837_18785 [Chloroflexaceae bacterium]|nr:hypothetical protein [Chloroflexaceae bacterium]